MKALGTSFLFVAAGCLGSAPRGQPGPAAPAGEAPECTTRRSRVPDDQGADAREEYAIQLTSTLVDGGGALRLVATGRDARHLAVLNAPVCNELTLLGLLQLAPKLRERGFGAVTCYPDVRVGFMVPQDGRPPTIFDERTGWYCGEREDGSVGGLCWRTHRQCAVNQEGCRYREMTAYCTMLDGTVTCLADEESCEAIRFMEENSGRGKAAGCAPVP